MMKTFNYSTDIVVVEDDTHDLELTLRAIAKCDSTIRTAIARDGLEALEYIFGELTDGHEAIIHIPRLVLLDLKLPKVNGLEVIKKIKSHDRAKVIPIIVFSSSTQEEDILTASLFGANSYLAKPVKYEEYSHVVTMVADYWLKQNQAVFH